MSLSREISPLLHPKPFSDSPHHLLFVFLWTFSEETHPSNISLPQDWIPLHFAYVSKKKRTQTQFWRTTCFLFLPKHLFFLGKKHTQFLPQSLRTVSQPLAEAQLSRGRLPAAAPGGRACTAGAAGGGAWEKGRSLGIFPVKVVESVYWLLCKTFRYDLIWSVFFCGEYGSGCFFFLFHGVSQGLQWSS